MKAERSSNWEMLRIIAMLMIIAHHLALYSSFSFGNELQNFNQYWILFIEGGGKIGANIFFLLSGYFLVAAKNWNKEKLIKLLTQVLFYSITIFVIFIVFDLIVFERILFVQAIFPFSYSTWWFATSYLMLYLLFPFLNILVEHMKKEIYQKLLVVTTICFCIMPTIINRSLQCNALIWAVYLYFVGGYIRLYCGDRKVKLKISIPLLLFSIVITYLATIVLLKISFNVEVFGLNRKQLYDMQALPVLIISVLFLLIFKEIKIKSNKIINMVSATTFGIYLLHENPYIRQILYNGIFQNREYAQSQYFIVYTLCEIGCIFIGGMMIEFIRMLIIEKTIMKLGNKILNRKRKT